MGSKLWWTVEVHFRYLNYFKVCRVVRVFATSSQKAYGKALSKLARDYPSDKYEITEVYIE